MITPNGYSKDPNIKPEAVVVTWSDSVIEGYSSLRAFIRDFHFYTSIDGGYWLQRCQKMPKFDVLYVYIVYKGFIRYRTQFVGWDIANSSICMTGPVIKAPRKFEQKGFRSFRYATFLF